jgi:hypothetical protein
MLRNNSIRIDPWSHWANVAQESWESWLESVLVRRAVAGATPVVDSESQPIVLPQEDHPDRPPAARAPRRAKPAKQRNVRIG